MDPLVEKIGSWFLRFRRRAVRRGVPDRYAEDVAQITSFRLFKARAWLAQCNDVEAASGKVALNTTLTYLRDESRRGEDLTSFDEHPVRDERSSPEEQLDGQRRHRLLWKLLDQLEDRYRRILIEHEIEGASLADIARAQGLPLNTVKTQHRRARERLEEAAARWQAEQRARGWDDQPCVLPLFHLQLHWRSWKAVMRKIGAEIVVKGAFVTLTGGLVGMAPTGPSPGSRLRVATDPAPVARAMDPADDAQGDPGAVRAGEGAPSAAAERSSSSSAPGSVLKAREENLITRARAAIEAHCATGDIEARRLLDEHEREFPRGQFAAERVSLLMQLR